MNRRDFLKSTWAPVLASLGWPEDLFSQDSPPLTAGIVGCGGRGTGAVENFLSSAPNVEVIAMADMFQDRLDKSRRINSKLKDSGFKVTDDKCFVGFDAYKRLLDTGINVVLLAQPPGFRPPHFEAAVEAGKHVFFEKPVCVDATGARRVIEAGERAREKKLAVVTGTQTRHSRRSIETVERIRNGQIGKVTAGRCFFNTGFLWEWPRQPQESDMEWQIRNWYYFDWLSGDHIVEQHVHQIDAMQWVLGNAVRCTAVGGRQVRTDPLYGNIYDHFAVDYEHEGGIHVTSISRQWKNCQGRIGAWVVGTKGEAYVQGTNCGVITGENPWKYEPEGKEIQPQIVEHTDLVASIRAGKPLNYARRIAETSLACVMGREAAYSGKEITWDQIVNSKQDLSPPKYEFGPLPMRPVPIPGQYKFI